MSDSAPLETSDLLLAAPLLHLSRDRADTETTHLLAEGRSERLRPWFILFPGDCLEAAHVSREAGAIFLSSVCNLFERTLAHRKAQPESGESKIKTV